LTLIGGLALAATFVGPDPFGRLLAPFDPTVRHPIMRITEEMRPLYQVVLTPPYQYVLVYVVAVLVVLTVILRFREYRLWEIALLVGLAGLANMAVRSVQDWLLVMLSLGVPPLVHLLRQWSLQRRRPAVAAVLRVDRFCKRLLLSPLFRFQWRWPVVALAVLAVVSLIPALGRDMPLRDRERDPVTAVAWIERELQPTADDPMLVFGPPDYGAYLVWRLGDRARVYVDTRGFCFPPELTADAHYIPQRAGDWQERLDHVLNSGTEYFFLETYGPRSRLWQLLKGQGVTALYADEKAALLTADQVRAGVAKWQAKQAAR
jgi:hypothetical protein